MKIIGKKEKYKGKFVEVIEQSVLTENGKKMVWEIVKKKSYKRIVFIFALTKKKEVILEKIYRIPLEHFIIELPAGLSDKKGETEKEAAKRELLEETGYLAKKVIPVFEFALDPGTLSNRAILFFAPDVEYMGRENTDDSEEIEVLKVPLGKLNKLVGKQDKSLLRGCPVDIKIFGAFYILKEKGLI